MSERHLTIGFPIERDVSGWADRNALGEVPSMWPYGLDMLRRPGLEVDTLNLPAPGRIGATLARLKRLGGPGGSASRTAMFAWDENAALRLLARAPRSAELFSGVIWATDRAQRYGRESVRSVVRTLTNYSGLVVLSRAQEEPLRQLLGAGGPSVSFVRFGVDETFFAAAPYPEKPLVLSVGGDRDRDASTLFPAMEHVLRVRPDVRVVVQTTSGTPAPQGVEVVPHLSHRELRDTYRKASVVAIATKPNLHVSGMTVSLEAMATGRPVVITRSPGMDDYVNESNGILVPPGSATALAEGVFELLRDPERASEMGRRGRLSVEGRHTTSTMADAIASAIGI